ncbi:MULTISPECIES: hypothetical protein [Catenuloplanes]|uniref:Heparin binding hemagglutinin HbhA n=1 Tax=Catenuloplanes niger TaxID=587534 RepID=A0AAE3ZS62_9ACTN|nr:hypothetical protein [Catenuloplanes niger]MDR7323972.1 hypothetical protein [Catenuloplanes niger]
MTNQTETTTPANTRIPTPLYAVAGAGDLAYQQIRKLPEVVEQLRERVPVAVAELRTRAEELNGRRDEIRTRAVEGLKVAQAQAGTLRERAAGPESEVAKLTEAAKRNAAAALAVAQAGAQVAQQRAVSTYAALVAHGERVVGTGVVQAADTVNADIEATEAPAEVTATPADVAAATATPADVAAATATPADVAAVPGPRKRVAKKAAPAAE